MATAEHALAESGVVEIGSVRFGDILLQKGMLNAVQLDYLLQKQKIEKERLGTLAIRLGLVQEFDVAQVLAEQRGIERIDLEAVTHPDEQLLTLFRKELCLTRGFMPLRRTEQGVEVVLGDGDVEQVRQLVFERCGIRPVFFQTEFSRLRQWIRQAYYFSHNPVESLLEREIEKLGADRERAHTPEKILEYLLHMAVRDRATDIHVTPSTDSLHVLFRVDGVMRPAFALPIAVARLLVYIKLVAEMDISEQRRPQDGSFQVEILNSPFTIRVSTLVSEYGERLVLRLLPEHSQINGLLQLGFREQDVQQLMSVFSRPAGMVLLTGPTGSGKSTTLHAALRMQSLIERNILTVEDPIEYRLPTACQTQVNRRAGYTFASAIRHFLRHDPDVMLVGEIRDAETADAAVVAAATGHLVLSTLHVNSVFGVVPRLLPFGLDRQIIADNLIAVVNQRLVRRNCPFCSEPAEASSTESEWLGEVHDGGAGLHRGKGCEHCGDSGYLGRLPVYEVMMLDEDIAASIVDGEGQASLRKLSAQKGFKPMVEMARWRVAQGQTTPEEVLRVLGQGPEGSYA